MCIYALFQNSDRIYMCNLISRCECNVMSGNREHRPGPKGMCSGDCNLATRSVKLVII